ncbi:signal recognition particle protein [Methylophilaceae bacterium]|nr:signal recognition particle protein [Methylophilaceae bacterium]
MLENLTDRLQSVIKTIRGQARFTEQNISDAMREVRIALIEGDVALAVVKDFIDRVKTKALGVEVLQSLSPGQAIIKIVQDELTVLMGDQNVSLDLNVAPPAIILMAGLQGSGKTTTSAKLAKLLIEKRKKCYLRVLMCIALQRLINLKCSPKVLILNASIQTLPRSH